MAKFCTSGRKHKLCFENCSGTDASKLGNKTQLSIQWNKLLNAKPRYVYHSAAHFNWPIYFSFKTGWTGNQLFATIFEKVHYTIF